LYDDKHRKAENKSSFADPNKFAFRSNDMKVGILMIIMARNKSEKWKFENVTQKGALIDT